MNNVYWTYWNWDVGSSLFFDIDRIRAQYDELLKFYELQVKQTHYSYTMSSATTDVYTPTFGFEANCLRLCSTWTVQVSKLIKDMFRYFQMKSLSKIFKRCHWWIYILVSLVNKLNRILSQMQQWTKSTNILVSTIRVISNESTRLHRASLNQNYYRFIRTEIFFLEMCWKMLLFQLKSASNFVKQCLYSAGSLK